MTRNLDGEKVAGASVARRVAQLTHGACLNLTDALTREVESLADFFKCARFSTIETEAQLQNFALTLIKWRQQATNLFWQ